MASQQDGRVSGMFRAVVRFYETKQYKKGLKMADQVSSCSGCRPCLLACLLRHAASAHLCQSGEDPKECKCWSYMARTSESFARLHNVP